MMVLPKNKEKGNRRQKIDKTTKGIIIGITLGSMMSVFTGMITATFSRYLELIPPSQVFIILLGYLIILFFVVRFLVKIVKEGK